MDGPVLLRRLPLVLTLAALAWCVGIGVLLWIRLQGSSPLIWAVLALPILLTSGVAVSARHRAPDFMAVGTGLFLGFAFVTGFSIGGAYHGPVLLLAIATLSEAGLMLHERRRETAKI